MQSSTAGLAQLLVERDTMLLLLMWETPLRGNDIGKISFTGFVLHDGQPIQAPTGQLQGLSSTATTSFQLILRPNRTKPVMCQRSGRFTLTVTEDRQHSFLARYSTSFSIGFLLGKWLGPTSSAPPLPIVEALLMLPWGQPPLGTGSTSTWSLLGCILVKAIMV